MNTLLCPADPPVITHRPGTIPGLLAVAEHAGWAVPRSLGNLGCSLDFSNVHFGCDIGVAGIMKELNALGAETFESNYSRAVLDPNRMPGEPTLIPAMQDGIALPANAAITPEEREDRIRLFYEGYHAPLDALVETRFRDTPNFFYLSVHSMEKHLDVDSLGHKTDGQIRPRIALLYRAKEEAIAHDFAAFFHKNGIEDVGMNVPYSALDERHEFPMFLKHQPRVLLLMIEFRNDLIRTPEGLRHHARLLMEAIEAVYLARHRPNPAA
jgi:predicted N-formylglutamate amidohydrolase